jgi:hypothetical protein
MIIMYSYVQKWKELIRDDPGEAMDQASTAPLVIMIVCILTYITAHFGYTPKKWVSVSSLLLNLTIFVNFISIFSISKVSNILRREDERWQRHHIERPPATGLVTFLQFVFTKRAFESVFLNVVGDMREEYFEALNQGHHGRARWFHFLLYPTILLTIFVWLTSQVAKKAVEVWRLGRS